MTEQQREREEILREHWVAGIMGAIFMAMIFGPLCVRVLRSEPQEEKKQDAQSSARESSNSQSDSPSSVPEPTSLLLLSPAILLLTRRHRHN